MSNPTPYLMWSPRLHTFTIVIAAACTAIDQAGLSLFCGRDPDSAFRWLHLIFDGRRVIVRHLRTFMEPSPRDAMTCRRANSSSAAFNVRLGRGFGRPGSI